MFRIWLIEDFDMLEEKDEYLFLKMLPLDRQKRILRMKKSIDRKASIVSWLMLKLMLNHFFCIDDFSVEYNSFGKPKLIGEQHVHFNISHCRTGCICAVSDKPIGVDIQEIRPFSWEIARHACCEEELIRLHLSTNPQVEFIKMWVIKESLLKMIGIGIGGGLKKINSLKYQKLIPIIERDGTYIAVASPYMLGEEIICID